MSNKTGTTPIERLILLIQEADTDCPVSRAEVIAEHLLANGVKLHQKPIRAPIDLTGRCGGCAHSQPIPTSTNWVRCNLKKPSQRTVHQRSAKGCKKYTPAEKGGGEET